jgi:cytochrome c oxidase subunit II
MLAPLTALAGCGGELSALAPAGEAATRVETLWQIMLWSAGAILAGVMGVALYAFATSGRERHFSTRRVLIGWGLVFPTLTLAALMGVAFLRGEQLLARPDDERSLIRVHAEQWGWRFAYPGGGESVGVLHVPAGRPFAVEITSDDVIHSFWVPRLGGKMDAVPGKANRLRLIADAPGVYWGQCSEYCGTGHAHMQFVVEAHPAADYPAALAIALAAAPQEQPAGLPVLDQRPAPAERALADWAARLLGAVGLR